MSLTDPMYLILICLIPSSRIYYLSLSFNQAELFTIPMKSQYLWGSMFVGIQVLILAVQTGSLIDRNSIWL